MKIRQTLSLLLLLFLVAGPLGVHAQGDGSGGLAVLRGVETEAFPQITVWFDVIENGRFVTSLQPADVLAIEDLNPRTVDELTLLEPGVHLVVAFNLGPQMAVRDTAGVSRLEKIAALLDDWAARQPADTADRWSLVGPTGVVTVQQPPASWRETLQAYRPESRDLQPDASSLAFALDAALDAPPTPWMKSVVLFITPHLEGEALTQLQNQQQRAQEAGVPVIVWWVDSISYQTHSGTQALQALADATGGTFSAYDEEAGLFPLPDDALERLRYVWQATYRSSLKESGEHALGVAVNRPTGQLVSNTRSVVLEIVPPNPIFITPPAQIVRQVPPDGPYELDALMPKEQVLEILVEFPDGHPRDLVRSTLYVDDQIIAENFQEPFDRFVWSLEDYTSSAQHILRVEVVDELGLSQLTTPLTVTVTVIQPPQGLRGFLIRYQTELTWGAVTLGGLLAVGVLFGTLLVERRKRRKKQPKTTGDVITDATLPVPTRPLRRRAADGTRRSAAPSDAFLERFGQSGSAWRHIPLNTAEMLFGSDPVKAQIILDDPSIAALHARIVREEDGYRIFDAETVAGTWVNYALVPAEGCLLKDGDVIHFGQVSYRFRRPAEREAGPQIEHL